MCFKRVAEAAFFCINNLKMIKIGEKRYYEIPEYAHLEGVTVQTVYNRINAGTLKTKKLLGKVLIES